MRDLIFDTLALAGLMGSFYGILVLGYGYGI